MPSNPEAKRKRESVAQSGEAVLSKKAAKRKGQQAGDGPAESSQSAPEMPITSGFGHTMLLKMGWKGQGSGRDCARTG